VPTPPSTSTRPSPPSSDGAAGGRISRACVVTHGRPETIGDALVRLARVAEEHEVQLVLSEVEAAKHGIDALPGPCVVEEGDSSELAIVLGGDGTTLRALNRFRGTGVPVFAVNYGRVGFLTTATGEELEPAVARAFAGEFATVDLPTLQVTRAGGQEVGRAVNDAVVTSDVHGRMAIFAWRVNGVRLGEIGCDAVVVSTPSGSTAYTLSAGGPVMDWGVEALCTTFVAPHSLTARSLVVPRGSRIEIENHSRGIEARVALDGHVASRALGTGECVTISLADERARLALLPEVHFLERYRDTFAR
jgi:NAD+ kinase